MPGAEVSINDESYGETPLSILLPAKTYRLSISQSNGSSYKGKVRLKENSKSKSLTFFEVDDQLTLTPSKTKEETKLSEPTVVATNKTERSKVPKAIAKPTSSKPTKAKVSSAKKKTPKTTKRVIAKKKRTQSNTPTKAKKRVTTNKSKNIKKK